jgi:hypothetical protein
LIRVPTLLTHQTRNIFSSLPAQHRAIIWEVVPAIWV